MDYRNLVAWQKSMTLAEAVYRATADYPLEERYGLTAQMRRAAVSIPSNIAEGQGRRSTDEEFARFLRISLGSNCELDTQLELSQRLSLIDGSVVDKLRPQIEEVGRLLSGLLRSKSGN
jgi:four helix bundle protein